jgi:hypothetical protein
MNRTEELEDQVRRLTSTVDEMKARMMNLESAEPEAKNGTKSSSRRGFLRLGAAAALGSMGWAAAKALPAAAANAGNFILGQANLAESPTTIQGDIVGPTGPPVQVLAAEDSTFSQANLTAAGGFTGTLQGLGYANAGATNPPVEGVDGWAQGTRAFGVYGLTDSGTGVVGESATGIGLYARRTGRIRQDGLTSAGKPVWAPNDFEFVRDSAGVPYVSVAAGVWKQLATTDMGFHIFPNPRRVYDGWVQPQAPGTYGPVDATQQVSTSGFPGGISGVPAGAQAAWCAVMSYSAGVMTIYPDGTSDTLIGNWASTNSGVLNMLYMMVPLSAAGKFWLHSYFTGLKFFDVWGYLV